MTIIFFKNIPHAKPAYYIRNKRGRKSLTRNQGNFLYYLPFPTEPFLSVADIIKKAKIEELRIPEVLDIIDTLFDHKIIEKS